MESINDYKARAYDLIAMIQQAQFELEQINKKIAELSSIKNEETVK